MTPNWSEEGFQRIIDAGKRSALISKERSKKLQEEYYKNPKLCLNCNQLIPYEKKCTNKYCSRSCSIQTNNKKRTKSTQKSCIHCGKLLGKSAIKFCSFKCQKECEYHQRVDMWISGQIKPKTRDFFRKYLTETHGYKCSCCSINEWNGKSIVLEIDHIDGNSENNKPENLRFICPNCHSQTDTYKARNMGKGRHYRRERYAAGQSY
jgi:hypothetical protein